MKKNLFSKILVIGIIILFFGAGVFPALGVVHIENNEKVLNKSASWWNYDWEYRKQIEIGDASKDYQMMIHVYRENGFDDVEKGIIDCEDHCNNDFSDIRFIADDHLTELPYWIEGYGTDGAYHYANIWIKTSGSETIFMYYGNNGVSSTSNGYDTWDWYEEWTKDNTGQYTTVQRFHNSEWRSDYGRYNDMGTIIEVPFRQLTKWKINIWKTSSGSASAAHGVAADEDDFQPSNGIFVAFNADTDYGAGDTTMASYLRSSKTGSPTSSDYYTWSFSKGTYYITDLFVASNSNASANIYSLNRDTIHLSLNVVENISSSFNRNYIREYVATIPKWGTYYWNYNSDADVIEYGGNHFASPTSRCEMWTPWTCIGKFSETPPYWSSCSKEEEVSHAPQAPEINGPTSGKLGVKHTYTFVTEDPDEDDVYYQIDWGDGNIDEWFGPYQSNEIIKRSHRWSKEGSFTIKARAKDVNEEIGEWGTLDVTMPKPHNPIWWLYGLLDKFPLLQRLLGWIIE